MLTNVYRKQEIPMNMFIEEFTKLMDKATEKCDTIIAAGDFNLWAEDTNNTDFARFRTLMNSSRLVKNSQNISSLV